MYLKNATFLLIICAFLSGCNKKVTHQQSVSKPAVHAAIPKAPTTSVLPPGPKREFRAVWVATINNIDWPSRKGLAAEVQQREFRTMLNHHESYGMNAVLVQVRVAGDAFYARSAEPWSEWLTGAQGKAPEPFYDPMVFMIHEAHQRNMEFHAWLNMNRGASKASKNIIPDHLVNTRPEWFLSYDKYKLFNLGIPEVRTYITDIVLNIVRNYDVDGIHFDDYFYPYTVANEKLRDDETFRRYKGNFRNIDDWRRNNVDLLIKDISDGIKEVKPKVKFGISPFGVWRNASVDPTGSQTAGGQTSYDNLYADTKKWVQQGWIDYVAPQVYFSFEFGKVPYKVLTDWWTKHNYDRHLYIGHAAYRVKAGSNEIGWDKPNQIPRQIRYNRSKPQVSGSIFFSAKPLSKNELSVVDSLKSLYFYPALPPAMPWKDNIPPNAPENVKARKVSDEGMAITWELPSIQARDGDDIKAFVVYRFEKNERINLEDPSKILAIVRNEGLPGYTDKYYDSGKSFVYIVTAIDRLNNESPMSIAVNVK